MKNIFVLTVVTENTLRVLQRMAGIFARNRLNIEQLNVTETSSKGISLFNIVVHSDTATIERVVKQLERIFELLEAKISCQIPMKSDFAKLPEEWQYGKS